jgi:hypothetical protein
MIIKSISEFNRVIEVKSNFIKSINTLCLCQKQVNGTAFFKVQMGSANNWILATGFWNDFGIWDDYSNWID